MGVACAGVADAAAVAVVAAGTAVCSTTKAARGDNYHVSWAGEYSCLSHSAKRCGCTCGLVYLGPLGGDEAVAVGTGLADSSSARTLPKRHYGG